MQSPAITTPEHSEVRIVYELAVGGCIPYHGPFSKRARLGCREGSILLDKEAVACLFHKL